MAEPTCDASRLARVGLFTTLVQADRALRLRLDASSLARGRRLGLTTDAMRESLEAFTGLTVPAPLARALDAAAEADAPLVVVPLHPPPDLAPLVEAARRALAGSDAAGA